MCKRARMRIVDEEWNVELISQKQCREEKKLESQKRVKLFVGRRRNKREGEPEEEGRDEKWWMSGELYFG